MKQFFAHYEIWEDYKSGMYNMSFDGDIELQIEKSCELLKNQIDFYKTCKLLIVDWEISSKVNLTNCQQNRKAWLGAAACCYKLASPEYITRLAWALLNDSDKQSANNTALKIINEYEQNTIIYGKNLFDN